MITPLVVCGACDEVTAALCIVVVSGCVVDGVPVVVMNKTFIMNVVI